MTETTGTGKWTQAGVPHKGWTCVDIEELEEQDHLCEMCEARHVRFVHVMEHPRYADALRVGCICAGHMEEDVAGARKREAGFKGERSRRERWLSRDWRISTSGNEFLNTNDGFNIVVYPKGPIWGARIEHTSSSAAYPSSPQTASMQRMEGSYPRQCELLCLRQKRSPFLSHGLYREPTLRLEPCSLTMAF